MIVYVLCSEVDSSAPPGTPTHIHRDQPNSLYRTRIHKDKPDPVIIYNIQSQCGLVCGLGQDFSIIKCVSSKIFGC